MISTALVLLVSAQLPVVQPADGPPPQLDFERTVSCTQLEPSKKVPSGTYRVQCDPETRSCLAAPDAVLVDGVASEQELARVRFCAHDAPAVRAALKEGWPFREAVAEAPPGWYRDERGRVMQVNFDLGRRVYFGGAWSPFYRPGAGEAGRARPEVGVSITWGQPGGDVLHRLRLLEGSAWVGADPRYEAVLARYDYSVRRREPALWLTTFVGRPRRFDLDLNLSWGFEVLRVEGLGGKNFLSIAQADVILDVWHSRDLESYVRARVGPGLEYDLDLKGVYFRPGAAVEADFTLDRDGFHHLTGSAVGEQLVLAPAMAGRPASPSRLKLRVGYEVILVAINDYPLTLVADGRATWRNDAPALPGWEFQGNLGLRFSFWAPARRGAALVPVR